MVDSMKAALFTGSLSIELVDHCIRLFSQVGLSMFVDDVKRFAVAFSNFVESMSNDGPEIRAVVFDWVRFLRALVQIGPAVELDGWAADLMDCADDGVENIVELMFSRFDDGDVADDEAWDADDDDFL